MTRYLFFTGKGGVGKTSSACATAVALADGGRRVLLVSTDPASNLDEVLGVRLTSTPTPVPGAPGLSALNIDPEEAARAYRERVVAPYRGLLPDTAVASIEEQLSGACTVEIAAFDEFSTLLGNPEATAAFDHVIFDTAPTGHTLRLLELPSAWSSFINTNVGGTSCLGPLAGLQAQQALYAACQRTLRDPASTTLMLVARPDETSLREAERTRAELAALGMSRVHLVLNGLFSASDRDDPIAMALEERGRAALATMPAGLAALPTDRIPLLPFDLVGLEAIRRLRPGIPAVVTSRGDETPVALPSETIRLEALVAELARVKVGVIMTMGKGGVGKTTVAARVATALAGTGAHVLLTTTDPAAHVEAATRHRPPTLTVARIDPAAETRRYTEEVLATAGRDLDPQGRALLEEDLRSPCTEEIAVFRAFAEAVALGQDGWVVIDTAPTGHTVLLLDAAEAYHREVLRKSTGTPEAVRHLLPRLRDTQYTRVLLVTLPEATPVHEALALERDLQRAGITPYAWVVNQSLLPLSVTDPLLQQRRRHELTHVDEVRRHTGRVVLEPWSSAQA